MPDLVCERCGASFALPEQLRERYPTWRPRFCRACHGRAAGPTGAGSSPARPTGGRLRRGPVEENLALADVLERYTEGPTTGVFTDGSANPNPGPGGWGAVYVVDDEIVDQRYGHEPRTTNNRMELTALIHGCDLVPKRQPATIYTDSRLAYDTITKWAESWKRRGWKRKNGEISNLDLVKELYGRMTSRPELRLEWIPAHRGLRWNEYADSLSTAYVRQEL